LGVVRLRRSVGGAGRDQSGLVDRFAGGHVTLALGQVRASLAVADDPPHQQHHNGGDDGEGHALAVATAGIAGRAFPRWLALPALAVTILYLTPFGFYASLRVAVQR
jgi:hypothetical protein